jgi:ParB family chromosome partitioning protein
MNIEPAQELEAMASAVLLPAKTGKLLQFDPNEPLVIGVDTKDGPEHELWDERIKSSLDESMVLNIMVFGVKTAIVLRKSMASDGKYEVVDGRGRILHAREANKRLKKAGEPLLYVPATLENGDEVHMESLTIALNEIRREDNTLVKAEKCMRLLQRNGNDARAAAVTFGVSVAAIKNWVKVAELTPKVKRAVAAGEISASAAAELHGLEKEDQIAKLDKLTSHAKANGKKKATTTSAKKESGKRATMPRRVLMRLIGDEELSSRVEPEMIHGIKLALGEHVPGETTKLGKLLAQAGYKY